MKKEWFRIIEGMGTKSN